VRQWQCLTAVSWDADDYERTVMAFRNAVIGSREASLWVILVILDALAQCPFFPR
jgi:hypothetical protein